MLKLIYLILIVNYCFIFFGVYKIKVITKLPNSEQSYKGKVKTHNYINRQKPIQQLSGFFLLVQ